MISITEKEEDKLDSGFLSCTKGNNEFIIDSNNVICYGEIDFTTGSEDYIQIEEMNWLNYLEAKGISIPADYNYEEHSCTSTDKFIKYTETFNPAVISQYIHGRLGKPKRVCIFKHLTNAKRNK